MLAQPLGPLPGCRATRMRARRSGSRCCWRSGGLTSSAAPTPMRRRHRDLLFPPTADRCTTMSSRAADPADCRSRPGLRHPRTRLSSLRACHSFDPALVATRMLAAKSCTAEDPQRAAASHSTNGRQPVARMPVTLCTSFIATVAARPDDATPRPPQSPPVRGEQSAQAPQKIMPIWRRGGEHPRGGQRALRCARRGLWPSRRQQRKNLHLVGTWDPRLCKKRFRCRLLPGL